MSDRTTYIVKIPLSCETPGRSETDTIRVKGVEWDLCRCLSADILKSMSIKTSTGKYTTSRHEKKTHTDRERQSLDVVTENM